MTTDEIFMEKALEVAQGSRGLDKTPFGALIVRGKEIISCVHNQAPSNSDPTCHAEVNAIRVACLALATVELRSSTLYTSCEPCPMCFMAAYLAKVERIVFGLRSSDLEQIGWKVKLTGKELNERSGRLIEVVPDVLRERCLELFGLPRDKIPPEKY